MIIKLLKLRFRAMLAGMTSKAGGKKASGLGTKLLMGFLFLYVGAACAIMMGFLFRSLVEPYHMLGLDWLYFAMAGIMSLGFSLLGSVFATQSQLYDARDNALLLSMPIKPGHILLSRMLALLGVNLLFAALVTVPAFVVYFIYAEASLWLLVLLIPMLLAISLLSQAIACFLGWLLHLLLRKLNKSASSMIFMVVFLGCYFWLYSQAESILQTMSANGQAIADAMEGWVWPLYAMGRACTGSWLHLLAFAGICAGIFFLVYWVLSATFLRAATASSASGKKRKLDLSRSRVRSAHRALVQKEFKKFLGTPIFLTNNGLGVVLTLALGIMGVVFRGKLMPLLDTLAQAFPQIRQMIPLFICAILSFTCSTSCVVTPTVSLEGKNIWILKSVPVSAKQILDAKLTFHLLLTVPVNMAAGLILGIAYGCDPLGLVLTALIPGLLATFSGTFGLWSGLKWAKLDYISEAHPCKQSTAVAVSMLGLMGLPVIFGLLYWLMYPLVSAQVFLLLCALILALSSYGLYRVITAWGVRKWEALI